MNFISKSSNLKTKKILTGREEIPSVLESVWLPEDEEEEGNTQSSEE